MVYHAYVPLILIYHLFMFKSESFHQVYYVIISTDHETTEAIIPYDAQEQFLSNNNI